MTSNVSDINALLTRSSSDALMGAAATSNVPADSGVTGNEFQGQLDKVINQNSRSAVEDTGADFADDAVDQTELSPFSTEQKPQLTTVEKNTEMSTVEKSRYIVRKIQQKVSDVEDALERSKALEFLSELKSLFLAVSNCDLDNLSLDEGGLEALGDLLVQAGFDPASVEDLISNLTLGLEQGDGLVSVSDFMDNLFELPLAEEEDITQAGVLMPTSDLPYIKTLLTMMGVDEQEIASIMDEVTQGAQGFDFDAFIEQLEQLLDTAQASGLTYQTDGENGSYASLLEQLDLDSFVDDESDEPLTLATLIDAFAQKLNQTLDQKSDSAENNLDDLTKQIFPDMFTTQPSDALATESGRHGLLNQLFSGLSFEEDSEETVNSTIAVSADSNAMVKEIKGRFQVRFMDQVGRGDVSANSTADTSVIGNTVTVDVQTGEINSDDAFNKMLNSFSDTSGTTKESASQLAVKAAQADAAALEKVTAATNYQSGETTSKGAETQGLVFGVEKSTSTTTLGNSGTQRVNQAFSTLPDFVTRQVGKSIVRSINTGDDTIRMQLKPPELGRVYMSIDHNGNSMKVSVITEHQSAKDILAANVHEIKTMLSSSGVNLESFEVDMSSDFQQSMADARTQDQLTKKRQAKSGAGDDTQDDVADNLTVQETSVVNDAGSLHFVA